MCRCMNPDQMAAPAVTRCTPQRPMLHGIEVVVSPDSAFDDVPGLRQIAPDSLVLAD